MPHYTGRVINNVVVEHPNRKVIVLLNEAMKLITPPYAWIRKKYFSQRGDQTCYCMSGALHEAYYNTRLARQEQWGWNDINQAHNTLRDAINDIHGDTSIVWFNDRIAKDKKEVIDMFMRAIRKLRNEGNELIAQKLKESK